MKIKDISSEASYLKPNTKGVLVLVLFRLATEEHEFRWLHFFLRPFYNFFIKWVLGVDLPLDVCIGKRFNIFHGQGLVVHPDVAIGDDVTLRHGVTIGEAKPGEGVPIIGSNVDIGAGAIIIGRVKIGDNAVIAAGAVVITSVEAGCTAVGYAARQI